MRTSSLLIAAIICSLIGYYIFGNNSTTAQSLTQTNTPNTPQEDRISVVVQKVEAQTVRSGIKLRGRTAASKSVTVKAQTAGSVISQPIRKGTFVTKGQLLCELDIGTRQATLTEAKARLTQAQSNHTISENLVKKGFASETSAIEREAALESAIAAVKRAQDDLNNTKITAPFNGLLESDTAELGDFIQPGSPCAHILSLNPIKLIGYATEQQVSHIKIGALATARLINENQVTGNVSFISRSADEATRTFLIEVTVNNDKLNIRDGATADILITLANTKGHLLPQSSLTLNDEGTLGVRIATPQNTALFKPIKIIRDTAEGIWVTGLSKKTDVIILGQEYVNNGTPLKISYRIQ